MKRLHNFSNLISTTVSYLFVILFVYAGASKLLDFNNFQVQLGQSPLLSAFSAWISWLIPVTEIIIAITLCINKARPISLYAGYLLMSLFTVYIIVILNYSSFVPCSCGGILEEMGWKEHLIFNVVFTLLALLGILLLSDNKLHAFIRALLLSFLSVLIIILLFQASEKSMHKENPFIRRFIEGSATRGKKVKLENSYKYLAGSDPATIFIADAQAPLYIVSYDKNLKKMQRHKIQLERYDFPFQNVRVKIVPPFFYLYDGTVPVIYKGHITDWKANVVMSNNNYFFSKGDITGPDSFAFRAQEVKTLDNIIGTFNFTDSLSIHYAPNLLVKQVDGFFDTDGILRYDKIKKKLVYVYYYRNEFIVASRELKLLYRGKTIDTTEHANVKVAYIGKSRQRKLRSAVQTVNQLIAVDNDRLLVKSNLLGRFEPADMWKEASIIDIYNLKEKTYQESIYIYHEMDAKLSDMILEGNTLYAVVGSHLVTYQLHKPHAQK